MNTSADTIKAIEFFKEIGIECNKVIAPIHSKLWCVKTGGQWAAFKLGFIEPVVPFGRYDILWGFDGGYCEVSIKSENLEELFVDGIINEWGMEIVPLGQYKDILNFYGKESSYILALLEDSLVRLDKNNPLLVVDRT